MTTEPIQKIELAPTAASSVANDNAHIVSKPDDNDFFSSTGANIIAAASSLIAGGVTAWRVVSERFHTNMTSMRLGEDIKEERRKFGSDLAEKITHPNGISNDKIYKEVQSAVNRFEDKFDDRFKFADTIVKKWGLLRNHQKAEVAFSTAAALGVVFGSVLLVSRDLISKKDREALAQKGTKDGDSPADSQQIQR